MEDIIHIVELADQVCEIVDTVVEVYRFIRRKREDDHVRYSMR